MTTYTKNPLFQAYENAYNECFSGLNSEKKSKSENHISDEQLKDLSNFYKNESEAADRQFNFYLPCLVRTMKTFIDIYENYIDTKNKCESLTEENQESDLEDEEDLD